MASHLRGLLVLLVDLVEPRRLADGLGDGLLAIGPGGLPDLDYRLTIPSPPHDVAGQFEDGLPQPAVLRFKNRKEPYRPTLWFSVVLVM